MGKKIFDTIKEIPFVYKAGLLLIFLLPLLSLPPLFSPPAFGKAVLFRIIFSGIALLFLYEVFFKRNAFLFRKVIEKVRAEKGFFFFAPLLLLFTLIVSTFFSVDPNFSIFGDPSRGGGLLNFGMLLLFAYFLFFLLGKKDWDFTWNVLFFTGVLSSLFAVLQWQELFDAVIVGATRRPYATFGNPTILGVYLATLVFPLIYFIFQEHIKRKKIIYSIFLFVILFGVVLTFTRAAVLGLLAGGIYFALFFPVKEKVFKVLKISFLGVLLVSGSLIYYVNTAPLPDFVKDSNFLYGLTQRMDTQRALEDPRIGGFVIGWNAITEKPLTGYGPENFAYAFDRHYHPEAPFIQSDPWWDKAHNIFLEIGVWGGFPAMIALLLVFLSLFTALRREKELKHHAMQATLITFFFANFFTIDDFSTYLLLAVLIAYVFFLSVKEKGIDLKKELEKRDNFLNYKLPFLVIFIPLWIFFVLSLNTSLLAANRDINLAESQKRRENCKEALNFARQSTSKDLPINHYLYFKKGLIAEECFREEGGMKVMYESMKEVVRQRPLYTRAWNNLGISSLSLIGQEENKEELLETALKSFQMAEKISPNRSHHHSALALLFLRKEDFPKALEHADRCLELGKEGSCFFVKGVALSMKNKESFEEAFENAKAENYDISSALNTLVSHHIHFENYKATIPYYLKLIEEEPEEPQYYASVAAAYREIEDYQNARKYALLALEVHPESAPTVEAFLSELP